MIESTTNSNEFLSKAVTVVRIPDAEFNIIPRSVTKYNTPCSTRGPLAVDQPTYWRCDHSRHFSDLRYERPPNGGISVGHDSVVLPSDANHQPATQRQDAFTPATAEQPQRYQACPRQRSLRDPENPRESVDSDFPFCGRG
ncbi:hypothetical protein TNCV_2566751 [Trichonephila clavipes]|uniref:Uncharacterized protein n=1 Tax=Trichonephila clavipes TaxID=2585209 RepID=A0A8X6WKD6_TRICX|nr:hypothetical protein TNCV_2566751 [Trichonephila clavipes]